MNKVRLSWYFAFFFVLYAFLALTLPRTKFESGALTLFSVNSFLYGFYISPILNAQKGRIEELHRIIRMEANAVFNMVLMAKKLPSELRTQVQQMFSTYLQQSIKDHGGTGEKEYEKLISFCSDYKGKEKEEVEKLLVGLVANQQNRTMFSMQMNNKVFSNEWMIILVLFSITLSFVVLLDTGSAWVLRIVTALLCTGLSMLLVILVKLSTLTHKKAKQMWQPFHTLLETHYYRID